MKYRIKEKDGKFYPQIKYFLVWEYFSITLKEQFGYDKPSIADGHIEAYFNCLKDAEDYIEKERKKRK